jgi:hypothetical protein
MSDERKHYTWEEKIDNLAEIAKAVGSYLDEEVQTYGTDYFHDVRRRLLAAYDTFCDWRHDEPYVVDEIKALLAQYAKLISDLRTLMVSWWMYPHHLRVPTQQDYMRWAQELHKVMHAVQEVLGEEDEEEEEER